MFALIGIALGISAIAGIILIVIETAILVSKKVRAEHRYIKYREWQKANPDKSGYLNPYADLSDIYR